MYPLPGTGILPGPDLPSFDPQVVLAEEPDCFGEGDVLLYEDTVGKGILIVIIHDPDTALEDDGAAIKTLVDKVHGAAGNFYPVQERLPLGVEAGKTGQGAG